MDGSRTCTTISLASLYYLICIKKKGSKKLPNDIIHPPLTALLCNPSFMIFLYPHLGELVACFHGYRQGKLGLFTDNRRFLCKLNITFAYIYEYNDEITIMLFERKSQKEYIILCLARCMYNRLIFMYHKQFEITMIWLPRHF